jgi:hypothetical protein
MEFNNLAAIVNFYSIREKYTIDDFNHIWLWWMGNLIKEQLLLVDEWHETWQEFIHF